MKKQVIIEIICFLFIILFVYAAVMKLRDLEKFRIQIGQSPLLTVHASWVAWAVPIIEVITSLLLAVPRLRSIGLFMAFGMMVMFTTYIIAILQFSEYIPCSCGGILQDMGWKQHLAFNIGFTLLGLAGIILHGKEENKAVTIA